MIFEPDLAPSEEQLARIGRIFVTWANLEKALQLILSRLALGPDWPTGALTDNLIFEQRLKAIDALVEIHSRQLGYSRIPRHICEQVAAFRKGLFDHRETRNRLSHWMIFRLGDEVVAARVATRLSSEKRTDHVKFTTDDLNNYIISLMTVLNQAQNLLEQLPQQPGPFEDKPPGK